MQLPNHTFVLSCLIYCSVCYIYMKCFSWSSKSWSAIQNSSCMRRNWIERFCRQGFPKVGCLVCVQPIHYCLCDRDRVCVVGIQGKKSLYCCSRTAGKTHWRVLAYGNGKQLLNNRHADQLGRKRKGIWRNSSLFRSNKNLSNYHYILFSEYQP